MIAKGPHRHLLQDVFDTDSNGELFVTRQLVNAEFSGYYLRAKKVKRLQKRRNEVEKALADFATQRKSSRGKKPTEKQKLIRQAIRKGLTGPDYARALTTVKTPPNGRRRTAQPLTLLHT